MTKHMMTPTGEKVAVPEDPNVLYRADGRVERLCEHGVGHPIGHRRKWEEWMDVHGCDLCCAKWGTKVNDVSTLQTAC